MRAYTVKELHALARMDLRTLTVERDELRASLAQPFPPHAFFLRPWFLLDRVYVRWLLARVEEGRRRAKQRLSAIRLQF